MPRVLVLFAHPALEHSRIHRQLVDSIPVIEGITFNDLYEEYPSGDIDVAREQALLVEHDVIVFQHPFYWYSTPPILKQWQDLVLEHGWAYGRNGRMLRGKALLNVLSAGGTQMAYRHEGHNRFTVRQLLAPIEQTARLCGMHFVPPYVMFGAHRMEIPDIERSAIEYHALLRWLAAEPLDHAYLDRFESLNAAFEAAAQEQGERGERGSEVAP